MKLQRIILSCICVWILCFWFSIGFVSSAAAADLSLPLTVDSDSDSYQLSPVTYNGVTYTDYLFQRSNIGTSDIWYLYYFNVDSSLTSAHLQYNGSVVSASDTYYIISGIRLTFHPNQSFTIISPAGSGGSLTEFSSGWTNFSAFDSILSSSRDIYNTDGTVYFNSLLDSSGGSYDPFSGGINLDLPTWEDGIGWVPYTPRPTYTAGSSTPIFSFSASATIYNVIMSLIVVPAPEVEEHHVRLYHGETLLADDTFTATHQTDSGDYILYDPARRNFALLLSALGEYRIDYIYDVAGQPAIISYSFVISNDIVTNQADITSACDSIVGSFDFYSFDSVLATGCKWVIPPNNYFSSEFSAIGTSFYSAFPFLFQIKTAVSDTSAIAHGITVIAPASTTISVLGASTKTYDFSFLSSTMSQVRAALTVIFWLVFCRYIMQEVKEVLGYHKSPNKE